MKTLVMMLVIGTLSFSAAAKEIFVTIGSDAVQTSQKSLTGIQRVNGNSEISVLRVNENAIAELSQLMHDKFNRCGGFIVHDSYQEAMTVLAQNDSRSFTKKNSFVNYSITMNETVENMVSKVNEFGIREMIITLSKYKNRYFKSKTGVASQEFVKATWEKLSSARNDVKVELVKHSSFPQPSVVMTIEGSTLKNEIVIIGGHGDSIAGYWARERARAPGADDNASGISTITEIIRVMMDSGYKPSRTIKFMSYAAEEVGLLGSKDIARQFKNAGKNVVGVMQFDMTNFHGSKDLDIVFMSDYTNAEQNKYLGSLIDTYVTGVKWGYSKCGYGCSDHASWHNNGYPASFPFEARMNEINHDIHTKRDVIDVNHSNGTAVHAEKFARLGVAYLVEMGK